MDVIWAKAPWPASPADLISAMLMARQILAKTNKKMQLTLNSPLFLLDTGKILTRSTRAILLKGQRCLRSIR